ncbi:MAG: chemotaxis protein CheW [Gemmatimonadota bacterium]
METGAREMRTARNDAPKTARAGKYLSFLLGSEFYGIDILKVQEIIGIMPITRVPRTPDFVRGVINLRGKVIPVIDLRLKFAMNATAQTARTCVIVVQIFRNDAKFTTGLIVDEVSEVLDIRPDQIADSPSFGENVDTDYIHGMGKCGEKVMLLLDIDLVLSRDEISAVTQAAN